MNWYWPPIDTAAVSPASRFLSRFSKAALWAACLSVAVPASAAATKLLRFPNIWHDRVVFTYAGDLWSASTTGGTATRLTSHPGLELFAKYSPDGRSLAFTAQYGGDEQVYVMNAEGGEPRQLTFYPANGPLPERWGYDNQVYGWTPDGKAILFRSMRDAYTLSVSKLYTVPVSGGAATPLPMPQSGAGSFSPDGSKIAYSPLWRDFRSEKRYQGGWANDLFIFDLNKPQLVQVTDDPRTDRDPMWIGGAIYFNSDRSGVFNVYRYDVSTHQTRAITHYKDWDVRWPSADALGQIVYELNGELHVYDTRDDQDRALLITVPADTTNSRPHPTNAADNLEEMDLSPGGERLAVVGRGDVFTVPVEQGVTRNLTHSSNAHEREVAWSNDGERIVFVSDRSGEEELYVQQQAGIEAARVLTQGSTSRYYTPRWSGDDKHIAFSDNANRLWVTESTGKNRVQVAQDPSGLTLDYRWSSDGQYLAYTLNADNNFSSIYLWSAADGKSRRVTPLPFNAHSPAFSPDGDLLYFLSEREFQPQISTVEFNFATDRQTGIFALALRKDVKNPYGVRNDEPGDNKAKDKDKDKDDKNEEKKPAAKKQSRIDFDGIEQRAIRVPVDADNLSDLFVGTESLLYLRSGPFYYGRSASVKPTVMAYSIKEREAKPVIEDVAAWSPTVDGKHVAAELNSHEIKYVEVGKSDEAKSVSLAGLATTRIPAQEWREIFAEVWRRYRDYFYVENMHGFDWQALRKKYEPQLDSVAHRADLNYVIAEMISELTIQHAYVQGGDLGLPQRPFVALPGARLELDAKSGRYRIARLLAGENEEELFRSPLTEVGVDVHAGDYVFDIGGRELKAGTDPYELMQSAPNQPVEWLIGADADGKAKRTVRFNPLGSESNLLYLAWVSKNRARVEQLSQGRVGYIHVPDMGAEGLREFIKWWYSQVRREGLIVDVRDNGGGNVSEMLITRLAAGVHGLGYGRNRSFVQTYPGVVQLGPKVALINEDTSSDGDIFSYQFRHWNLGKLIGKRTWGGVVGISNHGPLLDGGAIFVPEFGNADEKGQWNIEGHGVDPDIVVEQDPMQVMQGSDPQLERGVAEIMQQLPKTPAGLPPRPAAPIKTEVH
jgi:tricorn protease